MILFTFKTIALILAFCSSTFMILQGLKEWNENPVLISVDSLENPLEDIEFPAVTICPDFQPDHSALGELVLNSLKFNCDVGDDDCENLRNDLSVKGALDRIYNTIDENFKQIKFESYNFKANYTNCITSSGATPNLQCIFPFEYQGKMHHECIWDEHPLEDDWLKYQNDPGYLDGAWCSTKVDNKSVHVPSNWGNCGPGCPIPPIQKGTMQ